MSGDDTNLRDEAGLRRVADIPWKTAAMLRAKNPLKVWQSGSLCGRVNIAG